MLSERKSAKSAAMKKALLRKVREHFTFVRINPDDLHDVPAPIGGVGNPGFLERPMRARGGGVAGFCLSGCFSKPLAVV